MKNSTRPNTPKAKAQIVTFPVFASNDPIGRVMVMAVSGRREMQVSVRGERLIENEIEVFRPFSHEEIARDLTLEQMVEMFKVKMYNENIPDQKVYDQLFGDRLEREWARAFRAGDQPFWKRMLK